MINYDAHPHLLKQHYLSSVSSYYFNGSVQSFKSVGFFKYSDYSMAWVFRRIVMSFLLDFL